MLPIADELVQPGVVKLRQEFVKHPRPLGGVGQDGDLHLLNGMGSSYYPGQVSTALHTDLCSPVATNPTWSGLRNDVRLRLIASGRPLWHDLVKVLRPHVMLISVAKRHLSQIEFAALEPPWEMHRLDEGRSRPYVVTAWRVQVDDELAPLVVFGQAAQRPFGSVSKHDKQIIGRRVSEVAAGG